MRTAIFTTQKTTLTIETNEAVQLVQMSTGAQLEPPTRMDLQPGRHQVTVGAGVFKIVSNDNVRVTGHVNAEILTSADDKDGSWPDAATSRVVDATVLRAFFMIPNARSV